MAVWLFSCVFLSYFQAKFKDEALIRNQYNHAAYHHDNDDSLNVQPLTHDGTWGDVNNLTMLGFSWKNCGKY